MTTEFGKGIAQRTCAAADRTGHAILHTLYGQALRAQCAFFIEYFAIDLIRDSEGAVRGVVCLKMDDGTIHRFRAQTTVLATGGYGRAYFSGDLGAHLHRRRQRHGAARRAAAAGHGVRPVPPDRHLRRGLPHHRGRRAARAAISSIRQGERFMERYAPSAKDLASRDVVSRVDDHRDPRRPRRRQEQGPHLPAPRPSRSQGAARAAARHLRERAHLRRRRRDQGADPGAADRPLQHGRHPDELSRRGADQGRRRPGRRSCPG